jgi:hypothetical protein
LVTEQIVCHFVAQHGSERRFGAKGSKQSVRYEQSPAPN